MDIDKLILKFRLKAEIPRIANTKEEQGETLAILDSGAYYKATVIETTWDWLNNREIYQ